MLVGVPAKRGTAPPRLESQLLQRHREPAGPLSEVGERVAMEAPVRHPRDDLLVREVRLRPLEDRRQRQLEGHHQPLHDCSFPRLSRRSRSSSPVPWPPRSTYPSLPPITSSTSSSSPTLSIRRGVVD